MVKFSLYDDTFEYVERGVSRERDVQHVDVEIGLVLLNAIRLYVHKLYFWGVRFVIIELISVPITENGINSLFPTILIKCRTFEGSCLFVVNL